ncbi:MAG: AlwI family type II restriction endonuclease [Gammaproteobacteria bacterium]|jgi:hypothetical protein
MILWHLGNTTVRSPFRLRDGLLALNDSCLQGNLRGEDQEKKFRDLLGKKEIVTLKEDTTYSIGRKWRSALSKLGFIYPKLTGELSSQQDELGQADIISKNGFRLIKAENVSGWQECFLRALAAYYIPSILEPRYKCNLFSPLRHTLAIMLELKKQTDDSKLNFYEMALMVQCTSSDDAVKDIVKRILEHRKKHKASSRKKAFINEALEKAAVLYDKKAHTFKDYADTNFRYIKATGLTQSKGKGIVLIPEKILFIEKLVEDVSLPKDDFHYVKTLCGGAHLPTDDKDAAMQVLLDLNKQLAKRGVKYDIPKKLEKPADIAIVRHKIEEQLSNLNELDYAEKQSSLVNEISEYLELLIKKKHLITMPDGDTIEIPRTETPAYFEWIIWRAFLAINSLINKPWEARQFKIDQDFLPVAPAAGNRPDMIFEFDDMVLVVEVTLISSSRQESAEGESVRRHVAKYAIEQSKSGKRVFGLFIALAVDTNTANTFRLGEWYIKDDEKEDKKIDLHIVPVTLPDFKKIFDASKGDITAVLPKLKDFLRDCRGYINKDAPEWKNKISELAKNTAEILKN